jgi:predicted MFS family arabinose efflux permease
MLAPAYMTNVTSLVLRDAGESLEKISWLYAISMIWSANFLWAPVVDRFGFSHFGHYRSWILGMQILLFIILLTTAFFPPLEYFNVLLLLFALAALVSSTQDIATDALAVRLLSPEQRGTGNSIQSGGNLLGGILGGGIMLISYSWLGWKACLLLLSACVFLTLLPVFFLREPSFPPNQTRAGYGSIFRFFQRPGALHWVVILLIFRMIGMVAYSLLGPLLLDVGWELKDIGIAMYLLGPIFGLIGAAIAGWFATRFDRKRAALLSMVFTALAVVGMFLPVNNYTDILIVYGITFFLHSSYGFGCTVLYTLVMDKCDPASAGTDFSLQISLTGVGMLVAVSLALNAVEHIGYSNVLLICLIAIIIFMSLIQVHNGFERVRPDNRLDRKLV